MSIRSLIAGAAVLASTALPVAGASAATTQPSVLHPATGAVPASSGALDGYTTSDGIEHVNYIGTDGDVHEFYHQGLQWFTVNLNTATG